MEIVSRESPDTSLSPWWRRGIILILILEFSILIWITVGSSFIKGVPPIPSKVVDSSGAVIFTESDIKAGQQVLLKRGLMNNGTIWGHGAYLGPDFTAQYLHNEALEVRNYLMQEGKVTSTGPETDQKDVLVILTRDYLNKNRYNEATHNLLFTDPEKKSYTDQIAYWKNYFSNPALNRGLNAGIIPDEQELRQLNSFFAWTAWSSAALVPGKNYTYTNNFPHEPLIGNGPSSAAVLWSALSLITLLGGIALILFFFGRYEYLGWKSDPSLIPTQLIPGSPTIIEKSTIKFVLVAILVLFVQTLAGGALAHYFAESGGFRQFNLPSVFSSNILRTWHLQSSILWIATAYIGGGLFLSSLLSSKVPKYQIQLTNFLFIALAVALFGGIIGEYLGINNIIKDLWFWIGNQGWEYLEIGRAWQILIAIGLILWVFLIYRAVKPKEQSEEKELKTLFLLAAFAIPFFYLPAFFIGPTTHLSTADTWRFWIIHLWVEGFFEVFATVMVAILFYKLGLVRKKTATRLIYLDAVLFLGAGILGTGHHWYWNGQTTFSMAVSACFSAMEVVPLILLTLEASDFYKLRRIKTDEKGESIPFAHKWAFFFLVAVGVWNFVGAGIFGFLINLPVVSYYQTGTNLTANHGHGALMGVFGMLAIAFSVFALRQVSTDEHWKKIEKYIKFSFWGLNIGLAGMLLLQLFPSGVIQFVDVIKNGYWHARSLEFSGQSYMTNLAWLRFPADVFFIVGGVLPLLYAVIITYIHILKTEKRFI